MKNAPQRFWPYMAILLNAFVLLLSSSPASGQPAANPSAATASDNNGPHDFDFIIGSWKIHMKKRLHPLTGSNEWTEFDGAAVYRKIWDGRANFNEFETDSPSGHIEGLTLRTYNPQTHQWRLYWANSKDGILQPAQVGEFKNGRGEFFAQDTLDGKVILVRYVWSNTNSGTPHFEQSFSADGGLTWEVNWISDQTRVPDGSINLYASANPRTPNAVSAERDGQHDFDPLLGDWKYHLKRRSNPLTGSNTWVDLYGTGVNYKVWDGRANLDTIVVDGPDTHIEGLTLRLYDPQYHQWRLYWANSKNGIMDPPQIGRFDNGHGEFYAQDMLNGKNIFIRFDWSATTSNSPHFEQSFSNDGGKTWEVNWITDQNHPDDSTKTR
jgi:hypothetical protein